MKIKLIPSVISSKWLHKNLEAKNLLIFDTTIPKVTTTLSKRISDKKQIKNARFFDIKKVFSDPKALFPNTLLAPEEFEKEAQKLGVNQDTSIVVYDDLGIYSSARVWFMFKAMGHHNVAVLDGGLPAWKQENYPVEKVVKSSKKIKKGNFKVHFNPSFFCDKEAVLEAINNQNSQIIDARSRGRFYGTTPEPRKELRSGHIPTSVNLPYTELLANGKLKSTLEIKQKMHSLVAENKSLIFSCGSGITACILALGATVVGYKNVSVYDGSWTEWGSLHELPIEK